jgi:hypothetical protein
MFNELTYLGKERMKVCDECIMSVYEQIFMIADELKIPQPHVLKTAISFSPTTHQIGLLLRIPTDLKIRTPTQTVTGGTKNGRRRSKKVQSRSGK